MLGPRPYADVPAYVQALDVGVIPFRANDPFVQGINPNKVYQYLAAGAAGDHHAGARSGRARPDLLFADHRGRVGAARSARRSTRTPIRARRRALARAHDWDALAARMVTRSSRGSPAA